MIIKDHTSPKPTSGESARFHLSDYRLVARHNFRVARDPTRTKLLVCKDSVELLSTARASLREGFSTLWEWGRRVECFDGHWYEATMHKDGQTRQAALPPGAHFGQLTQMRDFGGLIMAESRYAPGSMTPVHVHETASFTVILRGEYMEEHRGQVFDCFPGKILFRNAGEQHRDHIGSSGAYCVMLEMRPTWLQRLDATRLPSSVCQMHDRWDVLLRLRRELTMVDDMTPLAVEALVLELCCQLRRARAAPGRIPQWLRHVQEKLEAEFGGRQSLQALAANANVHPSHLARAFHQHFGCSVGEYVRRRRIVFACERIAAGESLSHIAIGAGFANQPHFSRTFKAVIGLSPDQFRREKCNSRVKNVLGVKDARRPAN